MRGRVVLKAHYCCGHRGLLVCVAACGGSCRYLFISFHIYLFINIYYIYFICCSCRYVFRVDLPQTEVHFAGVSSCILPPNRERRCAYNVCLTPCFYKSFSVAPYVPPPHTHTHPPHPSTTTTTTRIRPMVTRPSSSGVMCSKSLERLRNAGDGPPTHPWGWGGGGGEGCTAHAHPLTWASHILNHTVNRHPVMQVTCRSSSGVTHSKSLVQRTWAQKPPTPHLQPSTSEKLAWITYLYCAPSSQVIYPSSSGVTYSRSQDQETWAQEAASQQWTSYCMALQMHPAAAAATPAAQLLLLLAHVTQWLGGLH